MRDDVFGGRVNADLIWESVVRANAAERRGTHATKNRALVSGSGKKPWRQKGTGRARVGVDPQPAVAPRRHGVRAAAAQLRLHAAEEGRARRAARGARRRSCRTARWSSSTRSSADEIKTKAAAELLKRLGVDGKAVLVDVALDEKLARSVRNIPGVALRAERAADRARRHGRRRGSSRRGARSRSCRRRWR